MFNNAVKWNLIPYNPAKRIDPPKTETKSREIYTVEQLYQFQEALEDEPLKYRSLASLALTCGLRREELFGLQWKHIDLEKRTVEIEQACVYTKATGTIIKGTKNQKSTRLVTFPNAILPILKQYKAEQLSKRLSLGENWAGAELPEDDYVFTKWDGKLGFPYSMNKWLDRFVVAHNLQRITPHVFRHMAATYLITAGHDIRTVSGKLGHSQPSTTMNIYSHLMEAAEKETANTMDALLKAPTKKHPQKRQAK